MKRIMILILIVTALSLQGCDLIEDVKWALGLVDYGRIEGIVSDLNGNPVSELPVTWKDTVRKRATRVPAITDESGFYRLSDLMPSNYEVEIRTVTAQEGSVTYFDILGREENVLVEKAKLTIVDFEVDLTE